MRFTINQKIKMSGLLSTTSKHFIVFISPLLLSEGREGEALEPSNILTLGLQSNIKRFDLKFMSPDRGHEEHWTP
jgi:hypothetical protein